MTARLAMPVSDVTQPNRSRQGPAGNETKRECPRADQLTSGTAMSRFFARRPRSMI